MNYLIIFFLINFLLNAMAQVDPQIEKIKSIIIATKNKFAPDKRTALFNVELVKIDKKYYIKGETNIQEAKDYLIMSLDGEGLLYEDSVEVLPSKSLGDKIYGVINLSVSNIRTNPEHPAELSTQALLGTPIKVLKKGQSGYYLIQTPDKYLSWLDDDGFQLMNKSEWDAWKKSEKIIYINDFGWAYQSADKNSMRVSDLVAGNLLKLLSVEKDFYKVEFPDKRTAYIHKSEAERFNQWYQSLKPTGE
ncbi:MAG: glycoside hydrolase, partial [Ignavibacterium sp.]|nr:glycoside hydrolase [Ignavibacterium sp.]